MQTYNLPIYIRLIRYNSTDSDGILLDVPDYDKIKLLMNITTIFVVLYNLEQTIDL